MERLKIVSNSIHVLQSQYTLHQSLNRIFRAPQLECDFKKSPEQAMSGKAKARETATQKEPTLISIPCFVRLAEATCSMLNALLNPTAKY